MTGERAGETSGPWMEAVLSAMSATPTAVRTAEEDWSGPQLLRRVAGASRFLGTIAPTGTIVPALLANTSASIAMTLAGALGNRPLAPLGTRLSVAEVAPMVAALDGDVLLTDEANRQLAAGVAAAAGVRLVVASTPEEEDPQFSPNRPDSVVLVLHTSGTTGRPKAVHVRDSAIFERSRAYHDHMGLSTGDLYCSTGGFHHTGGVGMLFVAVACGAGVVPFPRFSLEAWKSVAGLEPTCALLVPTMIESLIEARALDAVPLRALHYGTAPIHPDTLRATLATIPRTEFTQAYGMTEGGPISLLRHADHMRAASGEDRILTSVGRVLPNVEYRFDDVSSEGVGELVVRAGQIFKPDADGWLHTGDLGETDREGFLYLRGRKGDKIIRGGENIFPLEVERVLELHAQVREAAVVGVSDRRWGQTLKAVIVAKEPDDPPEVADLVAHTTNHLARFKVPQDWEFAAELPRNAAGKLLRHRLS